MRRVKAAWWMLVCLIFMGLLPDAESSVDAMKSVLTSADIHKQVPDRWEQQQKLQQYHLYHEKQQNLQQRVQMQQQKEQLLHRKQRGLSEVGSGYSSYGTPYGSPIPIENGAPDGGPYARRRFAWRRLDSDKPRIINAGLFF